MPGPVTDGRSAGERVGARDGVHRPSIRLDPELDADPLLVLPEGFEVLLPEVAWQFSEKTPRIPGANLVQGVAVFGEAAMFTAQVAGPQRIPIGMSSPETPENARFVLNVLHWLSGVLP